MSGLCKPKVCLCNRWQSLGHGGRQRLPIKPASIPLVGSLSLRTISFELTRLCFPLLPASPAPAPAVEAKVVHAQLLRFIQASDPRILGQGNANLPRIVEVFVKVGGCGRGSSSHSSAQDGWGGLPLWKPAVPAVRSHA